jgi:hypothetical protein
MPAIVDKMSIEKHGTGKRLDRRVKLTAEDKDAIRTQYFNAHPSQRPTITSIAAKYNVNRRLIQFILFPEREVRNKELARARRKDGRYYNREKSRKNMQEYRDYKRALSKEGKLKPSERESS